MKYLLSLCLLIASCSQDPPLDPNPNSLAGHYWICDSVRTTVSGVSHTDIVGQGFGLDVEYSANGTYLVYSNPTITKNYVVGHDTIYHWSAPNSMNPSQFSIIKSLQNKKLHTWESTTNKEIDNYHHYN